MSKYTAEQVEACILAYRNGDLNYCRAGIIDLLTAYAAALEAALSAQQEHEQAVAYRYRHSEQENWYYGAHPKNWWECQPLFTAPPAQPAERVPEVLVEQMDMLLDDFRKYEKGDPKVPFVVVRDALVAALNEWVDWREAASPAPSEGWEGNETECHHKWVAKLGHENAGKRCDWCGEVRP